MARERTCFIKHISRITFYRSKINKTLSFCRFTVNVVSFDRNYTQLIALGFFATELQLFLRHEFSRQR